MQLKNFPARIERKDELVDILARVIFIPVQHHIVAYPVEYYGGFVPNMSTKLYDDPRVPDGEFGLYSLPESNVTLVSNILEFCWLKRILNFSRGHNSLRIFSFPIDSSGSCNELECPSLRQVV